MPLATRRPIFPLGGAQIRYRPLIPIQIAGPLGSRTLDADLDTGSDDTIFPAYLAPRLGIDLTNAPEGEAGAIGGVPIPYRYAPVTLRVFDGYEECVWEAIVGFVAIPLRWAVVGHAGVLHFFDVQFWGDRRQVILTPNPSFPGQLVVHRPTSP
ncbi:MAG: hypothetical protein ACHRXM_12660 [Isosphaerales bacterium]